MSESLSEIKFKVENKQNANYILIMLRHILHAAAMVVMAGAFAPVNLSIQNPSKSYTLDSPTAFFSSANRNGRGEDSLGFFDDDDFDRILKQKGAFQFIFDVNEDDKPEDVHIILFNPDTDKEGVHTIEFPKDSGHNMILAFESRRECVQFSLSLKEQQFFDPTPQEMKLEFLEAYCEQIGVEVQVVPEVSFARYIMFSLCSSVSFDLFCILTIRLTNIQRFIFFTGYEADAPH